MMNNFFSTLTVILLFFPIFHARSQLLNYPGSLNANSVVKYTGYSIENTGGFYNVRNFGAKGDGVTDDTQAIQAALDADRKGVNTNGQADYFFPRPKTVYFPKGTYLISGSLEWTGQAMMLMGQGRGETVLRLKSNSPGFGNGSVPKTILKTPAGIQEFHNYIRDLSIVVGVGNPGTVALDFITNNSGGIINVAIQSEDGQGNAAIIMDREYPGPCLLKKVSVDGFNYAIQTGRAEYSITFEDITLTNQKIAGIENKGNILMIRKLSSTNSVPAVHNTQQYGMVTIVDSELKGGSASGSAIKNENGYLFARTISTSGYKSAIEYQGTVVEGASVSEYVSGTVSSLFPGHSRSLNLPVEETPEYHENDTTQWARIYSPSYGDTSPWQNIINSGKTVVYWPTSTYMASSPTYTIPAGVRKLTGLGSVINGNTDDQQTMTFRITEGDENSPPLFIEHFGYGVVVEHLCKRPVVIKHCKLGNYISSPQAGKVYFEDVELQKHITLYPQQKVWARQFNSEILPGRILNKGADLWILGIKTELKGYVIKTTDCGKTEVLGGLIYPIQSFTAADPAGFICENAQQSLVFGTSAYLPNSIYPTLIHETQNGVVKELKNTSLQGARFVPLHTGTNASCNDAPPAPIKSNQRPKGNAGLDKTTTMPDNSVTLTGTGSDPDGMITSYSWTQVSGPNTAAFSSTAVPEPTVSGLIAGSYVFHLVVQDNENASSEADEVVVTVTPAPEPVATPATPPSIVSFTLLYADNNQEIGSLTDGAVIDLAAVRTRNLTIRANTSSPAGSVVFFAEDLWINTDNEAPYVLADNEAKALAWVSSPGIHTVTAVTYTEANATGTRGTYKTVRFTVVNTAAPVPATAPAVTPAPGHPPVAATVYAINAGGSASGRFSADNYAKDGYVNVINTSVNTAGINDAAPQDIYQSERSGNFSYTFPSLARDKSYRVKLHFAENWFSSPNKRKFHVDLNGQRMLSKFDVYAAAGKHKAVVKEFIITPDSAGQVVITFRGVSDNAIVNGIEITEVASGVNLPEELVQPRVSLYPNPASDWVNIGLHNDKKETVTIQVINDQTTVVETISTMVQPYAPFTLPLHGFSSGVYHLRIILPDRSATKQLIIIQ